METKTLLKTAMFIAIGVLLPSVFHAFQLGGSTFLPMHIPVILCGFLLGKKAGLLCGLIVPLLSSLTTGMPPMYPVAMTMAIELAAYGFLSGACKEKMPVFPALLVAQLGGRIVGALASFILLSITAKPFALGAYITAAFVTAAPGIVLQWLLIPVAITLLQRAKKARYA
ncbi:MAG: ECF transporter S component [Erysipelotrichaceae bacterium]